MDADSRVYTGIQCTLTCSNEDMTVIAGTE